MAGDASVAVVGGSLAGLRTAEQLRGAGHTGQIVVIGAEPHLPYSRPPLSKDALTSATAASPAELAAQLAFRRRASVDDVEFRLGDPVAAADLAAGTLSTESGMTLPWDGLVVASGLRPRRLDVPGPQAGRHVLRSVEDAQGLRAELAALGAGRVVVVGAGFVGCETASSLLSLGHEVTVVEPASGPMVGVVGPAVAAAIRRHHEHAGINFILGAGIVGYAGEDRVTGVVLPDGSVIAADVVVEAVGSACNTEWLERNELDLADGVQTDNHLAATGAERVVAVGDLARFPNPLFDDVPRRVEHWSMPTDMAKRAARTLLDALQSSEPADQAAFAPIPSFWSDQLDLRLQSIGAPALADEATVLEGDLDELPAGALVAYRRAGLLVGTLAVNLNPARQRELRSQFSNPASAV